MVHRQCLWNKGTVSVILLERSPITETQNFLPTELPERPPRHTKAVGSVSKNHFLREHGLSVIPQPCGLHPKLNLQNLIQASCFVTRDFLMKKCFPRSTCTCACVSKGDTFLYIDKLKSINLHGTFCNN